MLDLQQLLDDNQLPFEDKQDLFDFYDKWFTLLLEDYQRIVLENSRYEAEEYDRQMSAGEGL